MRAPRGAQEVVKSRPPCEQRQRAAAVRAARWTAFSRASPPSSPRIQRANPMVWPPKSRQRCTHTADVSSAHRVHILRRTMSSHAAVGVAHSTGHWHDRHKLSRPRGAALGSFGTTDAIILLRFIASEALAIDFGASPKESIPSGGGRYSTQPRVAVTADHREGRCRRGNPLAEHLPTRDRRARPHVVLCVECS